MACIWQSRAQHQQHVALYFGCSWCGRLTPVRLTTAAEGDAKCRAYLPVHATAGQDAECAGQGRVWHNLQGTLERCRGEVLGVRDCSRLHVCPCSGWVELSVCSMRERVPPCATVVEAYAQQELRPEELLTAPVRCCLALSPAAGGGQGGASCT